MTFQDFQQLCDQAASTNLPVQQPCPIVVGDGEIHAYHGDAPNHHLIVFKTAVDNAAIQAIDRKVRFTFDSVNNQTVIQPLTTGT